MHPAMAWWKHRSSGSCGGGRGEERGERGHGHGHFHGGHSGYEGGGGEFGVRRPLRFLAYRLELNEQQVAELAGVLNQLKTERAQASVDDRRTTAAFADALAGEAFDQAAVVAAAAKRVDSATALKDAVVAALGRIHAILDGRQRAQLAYLIRTGALQI